MGTINVIVTPTFAVVDGVNVTTVNAAATLDMSFMRLFGYRDVTRRAVPSAELQPRSPSHYASSDGSCAGANWNADWTRLPGHKALRNSPDCQCVDFSTAYLSSMPTPIATANTTLSKPWSIATETADGTLPPITATMEARATCSASPCGIPEGAVRHPRHTTSDGIADQSLGHHLGAQRSREPHLVSARALLPRLARERRVVAMLVLALVMPLLLDFVLTGLEFAN